MALSFARYVSLLLSFTLILIHIRPVLSQSTASSSLRQTTTSSARPSASSSGVPNLCDALTQNGAAGYADAVCNGVGGGPNPNGVKTHFAPRDDKLHPRELALLARQQSLGTKYLYQISPDQKDSASLRAFAGSIIPTFETHANLNGQSQKIITHGIRDDLAAGLSACNSTSPINLFSGMGSNVTILKADIPYQGGIIHITDGLFTVPSRLTTTLSNMTVTSSFGQVLNSTNSSSALDNSPLVTVFAPSSDAFAAIGKNRTLSSAELRNLTTAHVVQGVVAYSPLLVDGTRFTANSGEIVISVKADGSIVVNGVAKVVMADVLIENGVVHVIDTLLYTPPQATPTSAPPRFTGAAAWSAIGQTRVSWDNPFWWSIIMGIVIPFVGGAAVLAV